MHVRFADSNVERLTTLAEDLVRENVDVLFAMDTPSINGVPRAEMIAAT